MTHKPRKLVLTESIPIRWGDMDALGHVNNTLYFRYMEQTRVRFFEISNLGYGEYPGQGAVIVNAQCSFRKPLVYPGSVEVRMFLGEPGRSSVETWYELWNGGEIYADGSAKVVWIDLATNRSAPLPERLRALAGVPTPRPAAGASPQ
jgi:acyl-CoA thioester hydrolase